MMTYFMMKRTKVSFSKPIFIYAKKERTTYTLYIMKLYNTVHTGCFLSRPRDMYFNHLTVIPQDSPTSLLKRPYNVRHVGFDPMEAAILDCAIPLTSGKLN